LIYLDHNATAPLRPCARKVLEDWLSHDGWGNASSLHASGRKARELVEEAREAVAQLVGAKPAQIIFTSGATEADNIAIHAWAAADTARPVLASTRLEHPAILEPLRFLEKSRPVEWLPASRDGGLNQDALARLPSEQTGLVCCMGANNETGRILSWQEVASWGRQRGIPVHTDLTQLIGKMPVDLSATDAASAAFSGHKLGALSGCGVLWSSRPLSPLLRGGPQERDRRAGTENLAGILSLGAVARWLTENASAEQERTNRLGKRLREEIADLPGVETTLPEALALPSTVHLRLPVGAEAVLIRMDLQGVCASSGSACSSGAIEPSETLLAMGWTAEEARRALRLSLGWNTTEAEIDRAAEILGQILSEMRDSDAADL